MDEPAKSGSRPPDSARVAGLDGGLEIKQEHDE